MSRINVITTAQATGELQTTLTAVKAKIGMVPNLFGTFANAPAVLKGYLGFSDSLTNGALTAKQREVIALAVGQANACQYCLSAHTLMAKGAGLSTHEILDARQGNSSDALTNALASLAVAIVEKRGQLQDDDVALARAAGVNDELLVEVIAQVALNTLTNYTNHIAQTAIDFPVVAV